MVPLHFRPDLLRVEITGNETVVTFTADRFDESNAQPIGQQLCDMVDQLGRHRLSLDLGEVHFLSSTALGKLITINKKVQAAGGQLRLCNVQPSVYEVFTVTQLTKVLDVRPKAPEPGPLATPA